MELRDNIVGQEDFVKKQGDILKFIDSMVSFGYEIKSIVENEGGLNYCDSVLEEKKPDSPKETPSLSADAPKKDD